MISFVRKHDLFFAALLATVCVLGAASPFFVVIYLAEVRSYESVKF
ncbi:MAG: hypothetical protein WBA85_13410 [Brucella anthropi]